MKKNIVILLVILILFSFIVIPTHAQENEPKYEYLLYMPFVSKEPHIWCEHIKEIIFCYIDPYP